MSDTNTTVNNVNTSDFANTAYTRNCQTYLTTGRSIFAVRARDIGRRLGHSSQKVSNDLGISSTALTNFVRSRNKITGSFDNVISSLSEAADYRKRTGKIHPAHRSLVLAVSTQHSTRIAAALGGISPSTASVWARAEKERIAREWSANFLSNITNFTKTTTKSNSNTTNANTKRSIGRRTYR